MISLLRKFFEAIAKPLILVALTALVATPIVFFAPRSTPNGVKTGTVHDPLDRLSIIAALSGGMLHLRPPMEEPDGERVPAVLVANPHGISACAPDRLSRAIVAVEMYLRPEWRRELEFSLYDSFVASGYSRHEFSLGPAQLKLNVARDALEWSKKEIEARLPIKLPPVQPDLLLQMLRSECESVRIAFLHLQKLVEEAPHKLDHRALANAYRGRSEPILHRFSYDRVVANLARPDLLRFSDEVDTEVGEFRVDPYALHEDEETNISFGEMTQNPNLHHVEMIDCSFVLDHRLGENIAPKIIINNTPKDMTALFDDYPLLKNKYILDSYASLDRSKYRVHVAFFDRDTLTSSDLPRVLTDLWLALRAIDAYKLDGIPLVVQTYSQPVGNRSSTCRSEYGVRQPILLGIEKL